MRQKSIAWISRYEMVLMFLFFALLALIYVFPLLQGLMLLPLDLLISKYLPWYAPGTILLKNPYMQDSIIQMFPWRHVVYQSLTHGVIPLWNPYQFMGMPFLASLKPMVFYPLNIFFVFGEVRAWDLLLYSQLVLGMFFAYLLAREFKLSFFPSVMVGLVAGLNSYMIGLLEFGSDAQVLIWFPFLIWCVKRFIERKQGRYIVVFALSLATAIFAGQLQFLGYFFVFLIPFVFFTGRQAQLSLRDYLALCMGVVAGFCVSAMQLFPTLELFQYSHRGLLTAAQNHTVFSNDLLTPLQLFRLFAPDVFGNPVSGDVHIGYIETSGYFGIIPLFFALFAVVFAKKNLFIKLFSVFFFLSMALSLKGVGEVLYVLHIPLLTSGTGARIFVLTLFSGAFLSGFGLQAFLEEKNGKKQLGSLMGFAAVYAVGIGSILACHWIDVFHTVVHNTIFPALILGGFFFVTMCVLLLMQRVVFMKQRGAYVICVCIVGLTFFDLFRLGYRFLTFSNTQFLYPSTSVISYLHSMQKQTLGREYGATEPELETALGIYSVETYNPLYPLMTASFLGTLQQQPTSSDNKYMLHQQPRLRQVLGVLGVQYIVAEKTDNPSTKYYNTDKYQGDFQKIYEDDRFAVYQNPLGQQRFGLYYQTKTFPTEKALLADMADSHTNLTSTLLFAETVPPVSPQGTGSATLLASSLNTISFHTTSTTPAYLYLSDTFFPGWHVVVNGKEQRIYKANGNFRAVRVPLGDATVVFTYLPWSFVLGVWISGITLVLLGGYGVWSLCRQQSMPKKKKKTVRRTAKKVGRDEWDKFRTLE